MQNSLKVPFINKNFNMLKTHIIESFLEIPVIFKISKNLNKAKDF